MWVGRVQFLSEPTIEQVAGTKKSSRIPVRRGGGGL
jgi:hypothetical protein